MEVVCGRCKANYEFDDALLSADGTTVRCTRCGNEFEIFPGEDRREDEWSVWAKGDPEPSKYQTFAELEQDIVRGKIGPDDLLARGADIARPLSAISELGPLLRRHAANRLSGHETTGPHRFAKTRVGLPSMGDRIPAELLTGDRASPPPLERPRRPHDGKKVRSALSGPFLGVRVASDPSPGTLPSGTPPALSSRGRPPLLSETLPSASPPAEVEAVSSSRPGAKTPSSRPGSIPPSSPRSPRDLARATAFDGTRPVPEVLRQTALRTTRSTSMEPASPPSSLSSGVRSAPGQLPRRRGARAALLVIAVLGGALAFGLTVGRKSFQKSLAPSAPAISSEAVPEESSSKGEESVARIEREIRALDWQWLRSRLLEDSDPKKADVLTRLKADVRRLRGDLERIPVSPERLWGEVDLLRMDGQIGPARARLRELGDRAMERPDSLALLDLADPEAGPPSPALIAELARARMAPDSEGLARAALVYALVRANDFEKAEAQYGELAAEPGGIPEPLLGELKEFIRRVQAAAPEAPEAPKTDIDSKAPALESPDSEAATLRAAPKEPTDLNGSVARPASDAAKTPATPPRAASAETISPEVSDWVARADALWSTGDQAKAVRLYQQVLNAVGKKHFLGQRASARILQAEREKANSQ